LKPQTGGRGGRRYLPYALTEHSALQVANILNSANAVRMSMTIGEEWTGEVNSS